MIASSFKRVFLLLSVLVGLVVVKSSPTCYDPLQDLYTNTGFTAAQVPLTLSKPNANNAVLSPPYFVAYNDLWADGPGPPPVGKIEGFNIFALSFYMSKLGPVDKALAWMQLADAQRDVAKSDYAKAGIKLIVSLFGGTDEPTTLKADPVTTANTIAAWVKQYKLDGVDVDYEDFAAVEAGTADAWLASFTKQLRVQLPQGQYILTHAPVAPWFNANIGGGVYLKVHSTVGDLIDWYNIQFYNQGVTEYTNCSTLLTSSQTSSALFQIEKAGVPLDKLVIGKPATPGDASNGYIEPSALADCLKEAKDQGWGTGVSVWQYPHAASEWIKTVRSKAFPFTPRSTMQSL